MSESDVMIDVWAYNLHESVRKMRGMIERAAYIFIDAEFPGVVARVEGKFVDLIDIDYQDKRENSNLMHPIQYGFAFFDENKCRIEGPCAIQFNFKWDINKDTASFTSTSFLMDKGFNFSRLVNDGIDYTEFAEAIIGSGLVCNHKVSYIGFQCDYDIIYLLKLCSGLTRLPIDYKDLDKILKVFFPCIYDFRYMALKFYFCHGLDSLGRSFNVVRVGRGHHAGIDALFTGDIYFRFLEVYKDYNIDTVKNMVYGVNAVGYRGKDGELS